MKPKTHHSILEDVIAVFMASIFVSLGIYLFSECGLLTGGTAGIAVLLTHVTPFSFGQIFFVVNVPFYYLAYRRMGTRFTLNTFVSVSLVSFISDYFRIFLQFEYVNPVFASVVGGLCIGMGILIMFRHVSSLGGLGVLSLFMQDRFGISAGKFQMVVDIGIVGVGYFLVPLPLLLTSILGAFALNIVIALNHKPGRYQIN
ncbi:YitT family protein [Reinekea sp.]|uniref:YitT family protein n=1 Tax=Reinekea sp. TaxID=1970455 RepID=UPI003988A7FC